MAIILIHERHLAFTDGYTDFSEEISFSLNQGKERTTIYILKRIITFEINIGQSLYFEIGSVT